MMVVDLHPEAIAEGREARLWYRLRSQRPKSGSASRSNRPPCAEQETEELGDDVIARINPQTGDVESLEVLFFSTRLLRSDLFELPVTADIHRAG